MGRPKKSKTTRGKKPRRPEGAPKTRKQSDATRMKRLSRELDRVTQAQESSQRRAEEIRQQMLSMRDKCSHDRIFYDQESGNIMCRDCMKVVGVSPGESE